MLDEFEIFPMYSDEQVRIIGYYSHENITSFNATFDSTTDYAESSEKLLYECRDSIRHIVKKVDRSIWKNIKKKIFSKIICKNRFFGYLTRTLRCFLKFLPLERCQSGRSYTLGKGVCSNAPGVRIPPSPPEYKIKNGLWGWESDESISRMAENTIVKYLITWDIFLTPFLK